MPRLIVSMRRLLVSVPRLLSVPTLLSVPRLLVSVPRVLVSVLFVIGVTSAVMAQDPVKVDSKHYSVEFENAQVRVLRIKVGPHEKSAMHRHPNAVAIFLTDATGRFSFPKGTPQDFTAKAGQVQWTPGIVHLPENTSDQPFDLILVELKGRAPSRRSTK